MNTRLKKWLQKIKDLEVKLKTFPNIITYGRLVSAIGLIVEVIGLNVPIGAVCVIEFKVNKQIVNIESEVIGFKDKKTLLMLFDKTELIAPGLKVFPKMSQEGDLLNKKLPVGFELLGRVLNSKGIPIDGLGMLRYDYLSVLSSKIINPLKKKPIIQVLDTGIRSINGLLTVGIGQKIGIFATAGVGKSMLLEMIIHFVQVDIIVVGLIGERSREIKEFVNSVKGVNNFSRSVIVVAPSEVSPILKVQGALYVATIAEYFRSCNKNVLLIVDSLTRYAMAQREISSAIGEFPISKGYSSSIFSQIPLFIERAGNSTNKEGSISAFYTVLSESNEYNDPVSDISRSILDGHIILSKSFSKSGHFPAIDIETSVSRTMKSLVSEEHYLLSTFFKKLISSYQNNKDLINVGAYNAGTDPLLDQSIQLWPKLLQFLQQKFSEKYNFLESYAQLRQLLDSKQTSNL